MQASESIIAVPTAGDVKVQAKEILGYTEVSTYIRWRYTYGRNYGI